MFTLLFTSVVYYGVGLNEQATDRFYKANLVTLLAAWHGSAYGLVIEIGVKNELARDVMKIFTIGLSILLSGNLITLNELPVYWRIISYISPLRFAYQGLARVMILTNNLWG